MLGWQCSSSGAVFEVRREVCYHPHLVTCCRLDGTFVAVCPLERTREATFAGRTRQSLWSTTVEVCTQRPCVGSWLDAVDYILHFLGPNKGNSRNELTAVCLLRPDISGACAIGGRLLVYSTTGYPAFRPATARICLLVGERFVARDAKTRKAWWGFLDYLHQR